MLQQQQHTKSRNTKLGHAGTRRSTAPHVLFQHRGVVDHGRVQVAAQAAQVDANSLAVGLRCFVVADLHSRRRLAHAALALEASTYAVLTVADRAEPGVRRTRRPFVLQQCCWHVSKHAFNRQRRRRRWGQRQKHNKQRKPVPSSPTNAIIHLASEKWTNNHPRLKNNDTHYPVAQPTTNQ